MTWLWTLLGLAGLARRPGPARAVGRGTRLDLLAP